MEVEVSEYIRYINNNTEKWYCDFPTDYEEFLIFVHVQCS